MIRNKYFLKYYRNIEVIKKNLMTNLRIKRFKYAVMSIQWTNFEEIEIRKIKNAAIVSAKLK